MHILTVSQLNEQIKNLLESHFGEVLVEGEVSRPTYHTSGHLYFSLKDKESVIKCVMFRSNVSALRFRLEDGQKVVVIGRIGLYKPRGEYQLYARSIEPSGVGALKMAFEQLKRKLAAEGLFDQRFKQPLPPFVRSIALVTSQTGAALQDMLRIINRRWPLLKVYVVDTLVQGEEAAPMIAEALRYADRLGVDVIVVGRGGGSLEDLWPFNEEVVARAIFEAKTPVVSAVGHEIDYLISDFVADMRAPTPSAAMEMILPDREEMLLQLDGLMEQLSRRIEATLQSKEQQLLHLFASLRQLSPLAKLSHYQEQIAQLMERYVHTLYSHLASKEASIPHLSELFQNAIVSQLQQKEQNLLHLRQRFEMALQAKKLPPASAQVVKDGRPVKLEDLKKGDRIELQDLGNIVRASVEDVKRR